MSQGRRKNRKSKLEVREDCDYEQQQSEPDLQRYLQLLNADHDYFSRPSLPDPEIVKPIQLAVKIEVEEFDSNTPYTETSSTDHDDSNSYYNTTFNINKQSVNKGHCRRLTYSIEKILQSAEYTVSIAPSTPNKVLNTCLRNLLGSYLVRIEEALDPYEVLVNSAVQEWPTWYKQCNTRETPLFYQCYLCNLAWWHLQPLKDHIKTHELSKLIVSFTADGNISCIIVSDYKIPTLKYIPVEGNCHQCGEDYEYHAVNRCDYKCSFCFKVYPTCGFHKVHEGKCMYRNKAGEKFCVICHQHIRDTEIKEHFLNIHIVRSDLIVSMSNKICASCDQVYHCFSVHTCTKSGYNTSCNSCCRKFATKKLGELHEQTNLSNIFCESCGTVMTKKCKEMEHMFGHTDLFKMAYKCVYCNEMFVDDESVRLHRVFKHGLKPDRRKCTLLTLPIPERCLRDDAIEIIDYTRDPKTREITQQLLPQPSGISIQSKEEDVVIKTEIESENEEEDDWAIENDVQAKVEEEPVNDWAQENDSQPSNNDEIPKIETTKRVQPKRNIVVKKYEVKTRKTPKQQRFTIREAKKTFKAKDKQKKRSLDIFNKLNVAFDNVALEIDAIKIEMDDAQNEENSMTIDKIGDTATNADENEQQTQTAKKSRKSKRNPKSLLKITQKETNPESKNTEDENVSNIFKVSPEFQNIKIKTEPCDDIDIEEHVVGHSISNTATTSTTNNLQSIVTVKEEVFAQFERDNMIKSEPDDDDDYDFSLNYSDLKVEYRDEINSSTELEYPDESLYPCSQCDLLMYSVKNYLNHLVMSHSLPEETCPCCGDKIENAVPLVAHFNRHVKNSFVRIRCLRSENVTNALSNFKCKNSCRVCHITVHKNEFFSHWEKHAFLNNLKFEPRPMESPTVVATNPERKLSQDILTTTLNQLLSSNDKRECCVCARVFSRKADTKRHLIEHLLGDAHVAREHTKSLRCQHCYEDFHKPEHYKFHMREHGGLTIYRCELCEKTFSDSSNFTKHSKVHNVKVLICDVCNRKFNAKTSLERHITQVHMHPEIQKCEKCDKQFYTPSDLNRHVRSRHGVKEKFRCHICCLNFKSLKEKWDHEWAIHNLRKYQADCPVCKMSFRKFSDVKSHCRIEHNLHVSFKSFCGGSSRFKLNDSDEICMIYENV